MSDSLTDRVREDLRDCIAACGRAQTAIAAELGISDKHLSHMLTGRAGLSLAWAEQIAEACGRQIVVSIICPVRSDPGDSA